MRFLFGFVLWIGLLLPLWAQQGEVCSLHLCGRVTEAETGEPVGFVAVYIEELGKGGYTDSLGNYEIDGLCPGSYTLRVSHLTYGEQEVTQEISAAVTHVDLRLSGNTLQLDEVQILSQRLPEAGANSMVTLDESALARSRGQTLGESLKAIAGVNAIQTGPQVFKPVIHGLHSQRVLILNQGVRQEDQQWGRDHAPMVDPFQASQISVVKGAAAIRYSPDAMAGVVVVNPPAMPHSPGIAGELNLVGMSNGRQGIASGRLEGAFAKVHGLAWRLQATGKYAGDMKAPDYMLTNTGAREYNFGGAMGYHRGKFGAEVLFSQYNTELGILRSAHIGSISDFLDAVNRGTPQYIEPFSYAINNPRQQVRHEVLKVRSNLNLGRVGDLDFTYSRQYNHRQEYDLRRGGRSDIPAMDLALTTHTLDLSLEQKALGDLKLTYGLFGSYQKNRNIPGTGVQPFLPWYDSYGAAGYVVAKLVKQRFIWEAGLRYDYKFIQSIKQEFGGAFREYLFDFHTVAGSVGGIALLDERWSLRLNLGSAVRPPQVNELLSDGLHHSAARIEEGDSTLTPELGVKAIATLSFQDGDRLRFELTPYYHYFKDFIFLEPQALPRLTIRGAFPVYQYTQTDAGLLGLDASLEWHFLANYFVESKLSLLSARDLSRDDYLIGMPANRWENSLGYSREKLGPFRDFRVAVSVLAVAQQTRLPQAPELDYNELPEIFLDQVGKLEQYLQTLYSSPPAYVLLGLEAGASLPLGEHTLGIQVGVQNLLNTRYREYLNNFWFYADEAGRNVSLKLRYQF